MLDTIAGFNLSHFAGRAVIDGRVQPHAVHLLRRGPLFSIMSPIVQFFSALRGKRTYLVSAAALSYLLTCEFTDRKPNDTTLGIFAALGVATLRAGIASAARAVPSLVLTMISMAILCTGCLSGGAGKVGTTELSIQRGANSYKLRNPKDTSIESFRINPDGSLELIGYRATVNEHLVKAAEFETQMRHDERKTAMDFFDRGVQAGARTYGINMAPANPAPASVVVPATVVLTNSPAAK